MYLFIYIFIYIIIYLFIYMQYIRFRMIYSICGSFQGISKI